MFLFKSLICSLPRNRSSLSASWSIVVESLDDLCLILLLTIFVKLIGARNIFCFPGEICMEDRRRTDCSPILIIFARNADFICSKFP